MDRYEADRYLLDNFYTKTIREISDYTGRSVSGTHKAARRLGLDPGSVSWRRTFNSSVTEDGNWFYFVGLMLADGHISVSGRNWDISLKDRQIIEDLAVWLDTEVHEYIAPATDTSYRTKDALKWEIHGSGKQFCDRLAYYGVVSQKTGKEDYFNIPDEYFLDFFRGFMDGDGNVSKSHTIDICATDYMCDKLASDLKRLYSIKGMYRRQNKNTDNTWKLRIKASETAPLDKMYYEGCLCLERKRVVYSADTKRRKIPSICYRPSGSVQKAVKC